VHRKVTFETNSQEDEEQAYFVTLSSSVRKLRRQLEGFSENAESKEGVAHASIIDRQAEEIWELIREDESPFNRSMFVRINYAVESVRSYFSDLVSKHREGVVDFDLGQSVESGLRRLEVIVEELQMCWNWEQ